MSLAMIYVMQMSHMFREAGDTSTPADLRRVVNQACISLLIAGAALVSAIFISSTRRYGPLIRKLQDAHGSPLDDFPPAKSP